MDEYDVLGGYVPSFIQHLKDTGARLGLGTGSRPGEDQTDAGGTAEDGDTDTYTNWTLAEQDAFFRAVSVYSRWRPDLIAACIPSKTEWEVWMYLETLEDGAAALAVRRDGEDVDMVGDSGDGRRDVVGKSFEESDSDADQDEDEGVCEPALEVSQTWIDTEERMAAWIVEEEHFASIGIGDDVPQKRKQGWDTRRGRAQGQGRARSAADKDCHSSQERSPSSKRSPTSTGRRSRELIALPAQRREVLLGHLGLPHLLVLDGILREHEEAMNEKSNSREGSTTGAIHTEYEDGREHVRDGANDSQSDVVIDPVLLAVSGGADPAERQPGLAPTQGTRALAQNPSSSHQPPSQPESLELPFVRGTIDTFTFPLGNDAAHTNPHPTADAETDMSLFSPRTRRRIQKRLYMRRKRASGSEVIVGTGIEKLRPGRKSRLEQGEAPVVSTTSVASSEAPSEVEYEETKDVLKKTRGMTLPYKLKAEFSQLGIDAGCLVSEGMDLLNMGALGKLMGLYCSLEQEEEDEPRSIDAQLIRHLQAAMVAFVTDVIHRAIVWREREIRMKTRNQAWRQGDHITIAAIEHAVAAVGARYGSHKEYLKALGARAEATDTTSTDLDVEATDTAETPRLSPHRDVYSPLVRAPSEWRIGAQACISQTYEREAARTRRGPSADLEDALMSDATDEEALAGELDEEAEADGLDMALGREEEERLWAGVNMQD